MNFAPLLLCVIFIFGLNGCSSSSISDNDINQYLHNEYFTPQSDIPKPEELFYLPPKAKQELQSAYNRYKTSHRSGLSDSEWLAHYINIGQGGFEYQDNVTTIAAQTFNARAGNCLSLVLLTAALAKQLDVKVEFQEVEVTPVWDKQGDFYLINGHINIKLTPQDSSTTLHITQRATLVDFLPERAIRGYRTNTINSETVMAMFYNNVAAESLVNGDYDRAFSLLQAGLILKPDFIPALNTLAVLYRYKGLEYEAETLYKLALEYNDDNLNALANYAILLASQERLDEWAAIHKKIELARINNPYYYYDMGQQAYAEKQYSQALRWYKRAVDRADYQHEFYLELAKTYWQLGDWLQAKKNLERAITLTYGDNKKRYQAKLHSINTHQR